VATADELEALARLLDREFEQWRANLTPGERCDLTYYQAWGFDRINRSLRGIDQNLQSDVVRRVALSIRSIDAALEKTSLERPLTVYRGVVDGPATLGKPPSDVSPGETFVDDAYLSTSLDVKAATSKAGKTATSLILKIDVPVGQQAAWFGQLGKKAYRTEYELLLPREVKLKVLDLGMCGTLPMLHVAVTTDE
jgi:hypothetical protein